jgi:quinoprotein glucose dehydrogenase
MKPIDPHRSPNAGTLKACIVALAIWPARALAQDATPHDYSPRVEPASDEGRKAMASFKLEPGFEVELFAAEPMLANPVCFTVDGQGNFYVAETFRHQSGVADTRDHMDWLDDDLASKTIEDRLALLQKHLGASFPEYTKEHERVRLIRDIDGDGKADTSTVFADQFNGALDGIGAGLLVRGRDVYYTCIPSLWLLRDEDGDGRAEVRRELSRGYGVHVAYLGHDLHGLRIGPDGKLYFSIGDRGLHVETKSGVLDLPDTGAVLRCNLDGSDLELFATGLRNPQELAFDAFGNLITVDNNSDGGDEARIVHVVEGGDSGWRFHWQWITEPNLRGPWNDEKLWYPHFDGQAAYIVPPVANLTNGPSGLTVNPGTGFPPSHDGRFFVCDFRGDARSSGIQEFALEKKGASFKLASSAHFVWGLLATDCDFAPDGALYFTDWVEGWNKTGKGRLYRVFDAKSRSSESARETQRILREGFDRRASEELLVLLAHADQRVRLAAELEIAARGPNYFRDLYAIASGTRRADVPAAPQPDAQLLLARLHALWALEIMQREHPEIDPGWVLEIANDKDDEVRAQAVHVAADLKVQRATPRFIELLRDKSPRVRMFAAIGLARLSSVDAIEPLFLLVREVGENDPMLRYAAIYGLAGCASTPRLLTSVADASPHARIAAVVALRRRGEAEVARFLDDADPRVVLEAARAIYDVPIRAAFPRLADLLKREPAADRALARRILNAAFQLGGDDRARDLYRFAQRSDVDVTLRAEALSLLAQWPDPPPYDLVVGGLCRLPKRSPAILQELVRAPIVSAPSAVLESWIGMAEKSGVPEVASLFVRWARDSRVPARTRCAALRALGRLHPPGLESVLTELCRDPNGDVRAAALAAYEAAAPETAMPLIESALREGEIAERRAAYRVLGELKDERSAKLLDAEMQKLARGLFPAELELDLRNALASRAIKLPAPVADEARVQKTGAPDLAVYLDALFGGDAQAGRALFREKAELACVRCHKVEDAGAMTIGPDLRGIGRRYSRLQILESIVKPNAHIAKGFENTLVFLKDESHFEGRILSEDERAIHLLDADGKVIDIEKSDVESRKVGVSAMPDGLAQHLTPLEMRDLIEYLATL